MMELLQTLKDYNGVFQLISITLIPIFIWLGSRWYQNRDAKRKLKQGLFLNLMSNRKRNPITQEWVDALNQIDVVFQDNNKVRDAWKVYFESLHENSPKNDNNATYQIELLSEIAQDLGYKNLKPSEITNFYAPVQFGNEREYRNQVNKNLLRVLQNSESFSTDVQKEASNPKEKKSKRDKK